MSAPIEALGLEPNWDRRPHERYDIRPHGTEARARRHRRRAEKPCPACLAAENSAHVYRRRAADRREYAGDVTFGVTASATTYQEAQAS